MKKKWLKHTLAIKKLRYVLAFMVCVLIGAGFGYTTHPRYTPPVIQEVKAESPPPQLAISEVDPAELFMLVNTERLRSGLRELAIDNRLNLSAQDKCDDMVEKNYFEHVAPDGRAPKSFAIARGVNYKKFGENLAITLDNANEVFSGWMASPTHKANMLDPEFKYVGLATCGQNAQIDPVTKFVKTNSIRTVQHLADL